LVYKILFSIVLFLITQAANQRGINRIAKYTDSIGVHHSSNIPKKSYSEIFGRRLSVTGDFNGDRKKDTLTEHYISRRTGKETNKFYQGEDIEYDSVVQLAILKEPLCYLSSSDSRIDSFLISDEAQLFGLALLENLGDLYGNGRDGIGYVIDWADFSSINSYHIAIYTSEGWKEIESFQIHESAIDNYHLPPDKNSNKIQFVKKIKKRLIREYVYGGDGWATKTVRLKKMKN
jgi:hypothetical protein